MAHPRTSGQERRTFIITSERDSPHAPWEFARFDSGDVGVTMTVEQLDGLKTELRLNVHGARQMRDYLDGWLESVS